MTVSAILAEKGNAVVTVSPGTALGEICDILAERRIGAVIVTDPAGCIAGILSERDVVRAVSRDRTAALARPASDFMTQTVQTCAPRDTIAEVMAWMTAGRFRHIPVVEGGRLIGIISIGDVVKQRIAAAEREAEEMRSYIHTA